MSTQQMTLRWTGTPLVALAEKKLMLPWFTMDQSKMCKENMNLPCVALFLAVVWAKKIIYWGVKCNVVQTTPILKMMFNSLEKEGALGEAVCQAQGLNKPKNSFSASGGGKLLVNLNDSTTI